MFECIENPNNLTSIYKQYTECTRNCDSKEKCDLALKILTTIISLLNKNEWKIEVKADVLAELTFKLCRHINELPANDYKKYVAVISNIHRCVVNKKCSVPSSMLLLDCIFNKPKMKLMNNLSKNYFVMLFDVFKLLEEEKCTDNKYVKIISRISYQYFQVIDTLVMDNFVWIIRRFDSLLNKKQPEVLNGIYQNIFTTLINCKKTISNSIIDKESNIVLKKLLIIVTLLHDNNEKCGYKKGDSIYLFFKFSLNLFQSNNSHHKILNSVSLVLQVFTTSIDKIPSNSHQLIADFENKLSFKRDSANNEDLEEVCLNFNKILCSTLTNWASVSDETWKKHVSIELQINMLKLISTIIKILAKSQIQYIQCVNCTFKSAIHDSLSLTYYGGVFCMKSMKCKINGECLFKYIKEIFEDQIYNLKILSINGCPNWKVYWKKMENNQHNDSILLYSNKLHNYSHKMFKLYIDNFIKVIEWSNDYTCLNSLAKGFYNMAICQSDLQFNNSALISCYMSWILNNVNKDSNLNGELLELKLVIQIKAKVHSQNQTRLESDDNKLLNKPENRNNEELQQLNVWRAVKDFLSNYENTIFYKIFSTINFGNLLLAELERFLELWPSTMTISSICSALQEISVLSSNLYKHPVVTKDNIGVLDLNEISITCGKAITLLLVHSAKYGNERIVEMINSSVKLLRTISKDMQRSSSSSIAFYKLLRANALFASSLCQMYEKRKLSAQNILTEAIPNAPLAPHHPNIHQDDMCDIAPAHQYLNLQVEKDILEFMYKAVRLWKEGTIGLGEKFENESMKMYASSTCEIIELCCQVFALYNNEYSLLAADVCYSLSNKADNVVCAIRSIGYIIENAVSIKPELDEIINKTNITVYNILLRNDENAENIVLIDACLEYLLDLSIYYYNVKLYQQGALILSSVSNRILNLQINSSNNDDRKLDNIKLTYTKMLKAQSYFISNVQSREINKNNMFSMLTCYINANMDCGEIVKACELNRGRTAILSQRMWLESGAAAGEIALSLGLVRRARALLRAPLSAAQRFLLPRRAIQLLTLLAQADLCAERHDDCQAKIDGITYILMEQNNTRNKNKTQSKDKALKQGAEKCKDVINNDLYKHFEMVLDVPTDKLNNISPTGSPIFRPTPFVLPEFISHVRTCRCYKCSSVILFITYINFFKLQAQLQFRNGEAKIAESFYNGGMKCIKYLFNKLDYIKENFIGALVNYFSQRVFDEYKYNEMISAECYFQSDAVIYFITQDEIDKAKELNENVLAVAEKNLNSDHFLLHIAEEHRLSMLQNEVFRKYAASISQLDVMDELQEEITSKLIITPEKSNQNRNFLTPSDAKYLPVNRIKRNVDGLSPTSSMKKNVENFVRPAIKLNLDEADNDLKVDKRKVVETPEPPTPAPKIKNAKAVLLFDDPMLTTRAHNQKQKNNDDNKATTVKNPAVPARDSAAMKVTFGNKGHPKVYANNAARNTMKFTISPNNILIETAPSNNSSVIEESPKAKEVRPLRTTVKKNEVKSTTSTNSTRSTRVQQQNKIENETNKPTQTMRYSTRKKK